MPSKNVNIRGVIVPLVTPFKENGAVDEKALPRLIEFLIRAGVHGIMPGGTTGEFALLTVEERQRILEVTLNTVNNRVLVLAQTGAPSTETTIALTRHAQSLGVVAATIITPYFVRLSDEALIEHYAQVAQAVPDYPLFLYNIPQMTGNNITAPVVSALVQRCPNIIGMKESSGNLGQIIESKAAGGANFQMSIGGDGLILSALVAGAVTAAVSGNANPCPESFVELFECYWRGDLAGAQAAQARIQHIRRNLKDGGDLSLFKAALAYRGLPVGGVRAPLLNASKEVVSKSMQVLLDHDVKLTPA